MELRRAGIRLPRISLLASTTAKGSTNTVAPLDEVSCTRPGSAPVPIAPAYAGIPVCCDRGLPALQRFCSRMQKEYPPCVPPLHSPRFLPPLVKRFRLARSSLLPPESLPGGETEYDKLKYVLEFLDADREKWKILINTVADQDFTEKLFSLPTIQALIRGFSPVGRKASKVPLSEKC